MNVRLVNDVRRSEIQAAEQLLGLKGVKRVT